LPDTAQRLLICPGTVLSTTCHPTLFSFLTYGLWLPGRSSGTWRPCFCTARFGTNVLVTCCSYRSTRTRIMEILNLAENWRDSEGTKSATYYCGSCAFACKRLTCAGTATPKQAQWNCNNASAITVVCPPTKTVTAITCNVYMEVSTLARAAS